MEGIHGQVCQMDYVLAFGKNKAECGRRLRRGIHFLQDASVAINTKKCGFPNARVKYWGHVLDAHGVSADPEKTEAITRMLTPETSVKQVIFRNG